MAQFSAAELAILRQAAVRNNLGTSVHWTKAQIGAALQAVEDTLNLAATKNAIGTAIENAPGCSGVFSPAEKTKLFALWAITAAARLGVS